MVDGLKLSITGIQLRSGQTLLHCQARGPVPSSDGVRAVTVFGEDGLGVCQGYAGCTWREVGQDEVLDFTVGMKMDKCYGDSEERAVSGQAG